MFFGLLIILLPLITGYLLPLNQSVLKIIVNKLLTWMIYVILFFMGVSLAFLDNLGNNLLTIVHISLVTACAITSCNMIALSLLARLYPWPHVHQHESRLPSRLHMIFEPLKLCGVVLSGFIVGLTCWPPLRHAHTFSEYALMLLLLLVGLQLRNSSMTLRQIVLNPRGLVVALIVCVSALVGGVLAALIINIPVRTGLALSSGFGWYSLSGIMLTKAFGPVTGSAAFFNDLVRELLAIIFIPSLITRHRTSALGICGSTSMDFALPVLQRSGGNEIVPAAIIHGFLLSLLAPLLMAFFSA